MLVGAVDDRTHALRDGLVLLRDPRDAREARGALRLAVEEVVVAGVLRETEAPEPVGRLGQELEAHAGDAGARAPVARARKGDAPEHHVTVVDRHPGAHEDLRAEDAGGDHGEEREQEVGDAPVVRVGLGRTVGPVRRAERGVDDLVARGAVGDRVAVEAAGRRVLGCDRAQVEDAQVARVDVALERLEPVARAQDLLDRALAVRRQVGLEVRQRGRRRAGPEIAPHDAVALDARVGPGADLRPERALRRLAGHVDADAVAVELPAVVHAAEPLLLVAAEEERRPAVRAVVLDQRGASGRGAKGDQVLAQEPDPDGRSVGLGQLARQQRRDPVLPDEVAHRRARADPTEELVVFPGQHGVPPRWCQY